MERMPQIAKYKFIRATVILCIAAGIVSGCGHEEEKTPPPSVDPSSPESYMRDEPFRRKLDEKRQARVQAIRERNEIVRKMEAMIAAKKAELKTEDENTLRVELEKDPAWNELYKQCEEANRKCDAARQETIKTFRKRAAPKDMTPPKPPAAAKPSTGTGDLDNLIKDLSNEER